jgi:hypothetical protein
MRRVFSSLGLLLLYPNITFPCSTVTNTKHEQTRECLHSAFLLVLHRLLVTIRGRASSHIRSALISCSDMLSGDCDDCCLSALGYRFITRTMLPFLVPLRRTLCLFRPACLFGTKWRWIVWSFVRSSCVVLCFGYDACSTGDGRQEKSIKDPRRPRQRPRSAKSNNGTL